MKFILENFTAMITLHFHLQPEYKYELFHINFTTSHQHMKDHVDIGHMTKHDAFRVNRDQAMNLEIWFKIHTNASNLRQCPPNNLNS